MTAETGILPGIEMLHHADSIWAMDRETEREGTRERERERARERESQRERERQVLRPRCSQLTLGHGGKAVYLYTHTYMQTYIHMLTYLYYIYHTCRNNSREAHQLQHSRRRSCQQMKVSH